MSLEDIKKDRIKKLETYKKESNPYPARVEKNISIEEILNNFSDLEKSQEKQSIVGRVMAFRDMGKIIFSDLSDETGKIQAVIKEGDVENFELIQETVDIGDFLEIKGPVFETKRGEKSLLASSVLIATKSIRPIPKSFYGIEDTETKLRKRYLDLLLNKDIKDLFVKKNKFWKTVRNYLEENEFLEVETPVLEAIPGGAEAEPFVTHHNALDKDFYLRISLELPLKKILVGGFEKVFEIGRIFRNEGMSKEHLQDYTQMECYRAYWDYNDMMKFTEEMYKNIIKNIFGKLETTYGENTIDWSGEWEKVEYFKAFEKETGIDLNETSIDELKEKAKELGINLENNLGKGRLIDLIYKKTVRPKLIKPSFLIDPPIEVEPLAKRHEDNPNKVERFQIVAAGTELGKGFSELNDPQDQRERFEQQMKLREQGDDEAQMLSEDFLEALEYGMPPAAGFGMSERLFAVLMNRPVRETVIFPLMREDK
ncbi:MAG: lysine--tRNA ligase [Candidatus Paceibacterota bacterium]